MSFEAMQPIDWITVKKDLSELAERYKAQARLCKANAASDDKTLSLHKDYWLEMAERHEAQAAFVDTLWEDTDHG